MIQQSPLATSEGAPAAPIRLGRWRLLRISVRALLAHRTRSALAVAGVAVGVAAIQVVTAVGRGAQAQLLAGMASQGAGLLVIRPAQAKRLVARKEVQGPVATLVPDDVAWLSELPEVMGTAPAIDRPARIRSALGSMKCLVVGTSPSFLRVRAFRLERGAFFTSEEDDGRERVAVLGARVRTSLFADADPVGQTIRIGAVPFEVIGALEAQGITPDGADVDGQVYIPLRTALRRLFNARALSSVHVLMREGEEPARAERGIRTGLRERHRLDLRDRPDDFAIQNPLRAVGAKDQMTQIITVFVGGLAAISLLVGGTGILGLMLLSVRERTPEIGLRRAVGARPRDVLFQFLAEATVLSAAGGLLGLVLATAGSSAAAALTGWPVSIPVWAAALGLLSSVAVGLFFGVWPARQAARLNPVIALSRE